MWHYYQSFKRKGISRLGMEKRIVLCCSFSKGVSLSLFPHRESDCIKQECSLVAVFCPVLIPSDSICNSLPMKGKIFELFIFANFVFVKMLVHMQCLVAIKFGTNLFVMCDILKRSSLGWVIGWKWAKYSIYLKKILIYFVIGNTMILKFDLLYSIKDVALTL